MAYAEEHFQREEALVEQAGFPRLPQHREMHEKLVSSIFELNEKVAAGAAMVDAKTMLFLKNWLVDHILKEDMDIGDFIRRKAAQAEKAAGLQARSEATAAAAGKAAEAPKAASPAT